MMSGFVEFGLVVAAACGVLASAGGDTPALQPPIDRKAWMVSSPSQRLRVIKRARTGADYPSPADYMRVLERFPALGERGWRSNYLGQPELGFFGDPDSAEMGMRSMGNFIFVTALLASDPSYDPRVTGVSRETLLQRAKSCLDYMTRSHVTGDIVCGDGKHWGNHWQSAWWTGKMSLGAQLIWDKLSADEQARVRRVVAHEASRHLARKAPSGEVADTKAEENAWDTEVMAAALALMPDHPDAAAWRAKLIEFDLNSLSVAQDRTSDRVVDGKPLSQQVYTENVHSDFTIENHGAYHFCYMACPLHSLAWGYLGLMRSEQPVPEAQFHHFLDVWRRAKPTFLDTRFAYMEGKDWPRYAYGLYFIMPALVVLEERFGDRDARAIEAKRFRTFEQEQIANGDGTFFGKRFTHNLMMDRQLEYESDCYANLGACYLLHRLRGSEPVAPVTDAQLAADLTDRHISPASALAYTRTPDLFASFAWKQLGGNWPLALFVPKGADDAVEWGTNNLVGRIDVSGINARQAVIEHEDKEVGRGFRTSGRIIYRLNDGAPAYTHEVTFEVRPEEGTATVESRFVADGDVRVNAVEGLRLCVASDLFNGVKRIWRWQDGSYNMRFDPECKLPEKEVITETPFASTWVNLDNRLGIVRLDGGSGFALRQSDRRNGPWGSIHYDVLDAPAMDHTPRTFHKGDVILQTRFRLVAGDARRTSQLASERVTR